MCVCKYIYIINAKVFQKIHGFLSFRLVLCCGLLEERWWNYSFQFFNSSRDELYDFVKFYYDTFTVCEFYTLF